MVPFQSVKRGEDLKASAGSPSEPLTRMMMAATATKKSALRGDVVGRRRDWPADRECYSDCRKASSAF